MWSALDIYFEFSLPSGQALHAWPVSYSMQVLSVRYILLILLPADAADSQHHHRLHNAEKELIWLNHTAGWR